MINQKGLLVIAAAVYFSVSSVTRYGYFIPEGRVRNGYYNRYAGEITEEKLNEMQEELNGLIASYDKLGEEYIYNLEHENDPQRQFFLATKLNALGERWSALEPILEEARGAWEVTLSRGIRTELVKPDTYELLLKRDRATTDKISLFILLCLIGVFSGVYSCEAQSGIITVQRSLKKGRGPLLRAKLCTAALTAPLVSLGSFAAQLILIGIRSGYNNIYASVQSIELLRGVPFEMSFLEYLVLICCLRMLFAFLLCLAVIFISSCCKSRISSLSICVGVIAAPVVLSLTGLLPLPNILYLLGYCI